MWGGWGGSALPGQGSVVLIQSSDRVLLDEFKKKKNVFRHLCCWITRSSSHGWVSAVFSPAVLHWDAADHLQIYQDAEMSAFDWDSQIFCTKKNKRLFYTLKRKSKGKIENRYFQNPLPKEIVTIMVISSTLVNTTFLINHFHECQHNCVRFKLRYKQGTLFFVGKRSNKGRKKGPIIRWENNLLSCKQLNLYCTFSQLLKSTFLTYLVF